jgi:hypothetical protein
MQDTIVTDPFYIYMPQHFGMSFPDLLAAKHPTTWISFERGEISHDQALEDFFQDGRHVDSAELEAMMACPAHLQAAACAPCLRPHSPNCLQCEQLFS